MDVVHVESVTDTYLVEWPGAIAGAQPLGKFLYCVGVLRPGVPQMSVFDCSWILARSLLRIADFPAK